MLQGCSGCRCIPAPARCSRMRLRHQCKSTRFQNFSGCPPILFAPVHRTGCKRRGALGLTLQAWQNNELRQTANEANKNSLVVGPPHPPSREPIQKLDSARQQDTLHVSPGKRPRQACNHRLLHSTIRLMPNTRLVDLILCAALLG